VCRPTCCTVPGVTQIGKTDRNALTTDTEPLVTKFTLAGQLFVRKFCAEFHENPVDRLFADIVQDTEGQLVCAVLVGQLALRGLLRERERGRCSEKRYIIIIIIIITEETGSLAVTKVPWQCPLVHLV
jgi:hypothetical protein